MMPDQNVDSTSVTMINQNLDDGHLHRMPALRCCEPIVRLAAPQTQHHVFATMSRRGLGARVSRLRVAGLAVSICASASLPCVLALQPTSKKLHLAAANNQLEAVTALLNGGDHVDSIDDVSAWPDLDGACMGWCETMCVRRRRAGRRCTRPSRAAISRWPSCCCPGARAWAPARAAA